MMQQIKDKIKHAIEHQEELIKMFATDPDKKLEEQLNIIHLQVLVCEQNKDEEAGEFFAIMKHIIIAARIYKWDFKIPDREDEMAQEIAEIDLAQEKHEHRKSLLAKLSKPILTEPLEPKREAKTDTSGQLDLF